MRIFSLLFILSFSVLAQLPSVSTRVIEGGLFSYYSSQSLDKLDEDIEHAIITVHGSVRNADTYYKSVWAMTKKVGEQDSTIVISPHFKIRGDKLTKNELFYSYEGWWIGNDSIDKNRVSSFSVIDHFLIQLSTSGKFPNLKKITLTGHSAGGHMTQRFALGSVADLRFSKVDIKYVVANPGTYAYLNAKRPVPGQFAIFEIPRNPGCAYNHYKYGLERRNSYMSRDSKKNMIKRFIKRKVIYFLGEQDIGDVEQTCQARWQGPHRLGRGQNFKAHVDSEYPFNNHDIVTVPGIGHTQYGMYTSTQGLEVLFK
jgi:hypothetical protein